MHHIPFFESESGRDSLHPSNQICIYIYVNVGSVPLNSKAGLDPGLNLLMQRIIHLGMRIWFLDWRPHV